jgi:Tfp pilus assembly protein PilN
MTQASTSSTTRKRSSSKNRNSNKTAASRNGASSPVSSAGQTVAEAASKARTPLIAGGAALGGAAATLLVKNRMNARKGPIQKLRAVSLPKSNAKLLKNLDLGTVKSAAERVSSFGQQAADIAAAAEKTNKKHG